jgi:hypothetical protein
LTIGVIQKNNAEALTNAEPSTLNRAFNRLSSIVHILMLISTMSFDRDRRSSGDDDGSKKRPYDHSHHSSYDRQYEDSSDDEGSKKRPPARSTSSTKVGEASTGLLIDRPTERDVLFGRGAVRNLNGEV